MRTRVLVIVLIALLSDGQILAQDKAQDTLPDNHLPFTLVRVENRLEGASEYLEGFSISMDLHGDALRDGLDSVRLLSMVRSQPATGILTYPDGKTTKIEYEVVDHRGTDDIYMKTTLGYFLWDSFEVLNDRLTFIIDWWYCPPASESDLLILEMTASLLADSSNWHQYDDRKCEPDIKDSTWSLFCALKYASINITGEYNHHNTAMQYVRSAIDEMVPDHDFSHPLMGFNNAPGTSHSAIKDVLEKAKNRIRQELKLTSE